MCDLKEFYREAVLWFNLDHKHVLQFRGISEEPDNLPGLCMILQWAENQDLQHYLETLVIEGLCGPLFVSKVNRWVCGLFSNLRHKMLTPIWGSYVESFED